MTDSNIALVKVPIHLAPTPGVQCDLTTLKLNELEALADLAIINAAGFDDVLWLTLHEIRNSNKWVTDDPQYTFGMYLRDWSARVRSKTGREIPLRKIWHYLAALRIFVDCWGFEAAPILALAPVTLESFRRALGEWDAKTGQIKRFRKPVLAILDQLYPQEQGKPFRQAHKALAELLTLEPGPATEAFLRKLRVPRKEVMRFEVISVNPLQIRGIVEVYDKEHGRKIHEYVYEPETRWPRSLLRALSRKLRRTK